ncbi:MAG: HD domain-containing phosphohydrolase [Phycisphaerae bacterium]|nr:HD domain-containing phosphohydrolase [Phycisphaerae bacterium]
MAVSEITARAPVDGAMLARVAAETLQATGVTVEFFRADGSALGAAPGSPCDAATSRLVTEAEATGAFRVERHGRRFVAAWPIGRRGRVVLVATGTVEAVAGGRPQALLAAVARAVCAEFERQIARAESEASAEALAQSFEEISLLHNLGKVLRVTQPVSELLDRICIELRETIGAEAAAAYLPQVEGLGPERVIAGRLPFDADLLPRLVDHVLDSLGPEQTVVIINHCQEDPFLAGLSIALERLVLVPLPLREGVSGALVAVNRSPGEFGSPDAKLVRSLTASAAVFVENRRLYRDLHQLMLDLVRALASSIDAKDPYTCGHSERVAITSREIARHLGLSEQQIEWVYLAGLVHDIGKIGTPEHILRKEGRLDPEERQIVQRHPGVGGHILEGIRRLEPIRDAVVHHHERLDGSGYPDGLKGDAVPILARIIGLADAFDAMTSNRPYRPMMPLEHVRLEIERNVGTQFDVRAVDALFALDMSRLMSQFAERTTACTAPA